ncbi:MAG TPA: hypothetical protein VNJ03_09660 [Vicinamibacterales bacterium]|nr:hypothetical protein [Vicinamibacterales bacterium]
MLQFSSVPDYSESDLHRWVAGDYDLLGRSGISSFIREILREKAATRLEGRRKRKQPGDRRFFGEAYVARRIPHQEGWYGSFKWLTSPACLSETGRVGRFAGAYGVALKHHFGNHLSGLRERARLLSDSHGVKPMPPDLWLISGGKHRFIEAKLRGDNVRESQLAGLAVIAVSLCAAVPMSVEVVRAFSECEPRRPAKEESENRRMLDSFKEFCRVLHRA